MSDEILTVDVVRGTPGNRWIKCPHCKDTVCLPPGPVRGEQFKHRNCESWFDVAHDAKLENAE